MNARTWARRAASVAVTLLAVVVVAAFVVQAAPGAVGAEESYVVLSGSMEPAISPGDAVVVRHVAPENVGAGDVITFQRAGESTPVTHRVVEVVERDGGLAFRTQGDANEDPDPTLVPADALVGEVWFAMPLVGHVVLFANTLLGRVLFVVVPLLAFGASELYAYATADDGDEDAGDPTPVSVGPAPESSADAGGVALSTTDLRLSSFVLGAFAAYSAYVAYTDPSPVAVAVVAATAVSLAFVAVVFVLGDAPDSRPTSARTDGGDSERGDADGS
ncbi:signal peptidase I [Halobacterium litoreum]|uniref:Signal peptidase I n=1 Tax=Halobacterium litoreum TaxID=2039234 RepID=A0ABD5NCP5_9EURY|nr:signal peptidase I [Halobacterium litoreum]UHH14062.1 signal peptidase I [Halobacterium litoreum]